MYREIEREDRPNTDTVRSVIVTRDWFYRFDFLILM